MDRLSLPTKCSSKAGNGCWSRRAGEQVNGKRETEGRGRREWTEDRKQKTELGLIGFVFCTSAKSFVFIILSFNRAYVHLGIRQIGFVLHKATRMVEILNPNIEIRNKFENQIFKYSKRGLIEFDWACWP